MIIDELVSLSNLYGSNEELVLAGGGNTSAKDGDVMYIKGSGTQLATITADGFVKMNRQALADIFTKDYPTDDDAREAQALADLSAARMPGEESKRPSVETLLHSLFPHTFVLHVHPALVNGLTCAVNGKAEAERMSLDRVSFEGRRNNVADYYRKASVVALTSETEGWPLAMTEAQAHGCICIAFGCTSGVKEVLAPNGECGFIVPPFDEECYADTLLKIASLPEEEQLKIRQQAVAKRSEYAPEHIAAKWKKLFDNLTI